MHEVEEPTSATSAVANRHTMSYTKTTLKPTSSTQVAKDNIIAWKQYFLLTRMHMWPLGSDTFWFGTMWGLLMAVYRTGLPLQKVCMDTLVLAVACTFCHNASCIWNDICDRDIDGRVERTKTRPLPSGLISVPAALLWLAVHTSAYLATLSYFGPETVNAGVLFCAAMAVYPLAKRFTHWPQAFLGTTCAINVLVGWAASHQAFDWPVVAPLCVGAFSWTIYIDTLYACPDKPYDKEIGVYSAALLFGPYIRPLLSVFAASFVAGFAYAGYLNEQGPVYYIVSVGLTAANLAWQLVTTTDFEKEGTKLFKANAAMGYIAVGGFFADYVVKVIL
ncbi:UbiA prenyltransferase [Fomitopsis betulina]|nr:UbiA prenyltransferase [Fomitopsis betulina]